MKDISHQGDVFSTHISSDPSLTEIDSSWEEVSLDSIHGQNGLIVQHGEALGHYHVIPKDQAKAANARLFVVTSANGIKTLLLVNQKPVEMVHPEHGPKVFEPGKHVIRTQREWVNGLARPVLD